MHKILIPTIAFGLISGLIGALAYDQLASGAGAAPPPPPATQVREQNLDGGGFIRVHEQGTANVTGTVNVGNFPAEPQGRLISLGTQTVLAGGLNYASAFVDVSDCGSATAMATSTVGGPGIGIAIEASPDGI